jgi:hypothetical protein
MMEFAEGLAKEKTISPNTTTLTEIARVLQRRKVVGGKIRQKGE